MKQGNNKKTGHQNADLSVCVCVRSNINRGVVTNCAANKALCNFD